MLWIRDVFVSMIRDVFWLETPAPKVLGSDKNSKSNKSRIQMLLASLF